MGSLEFKECLAIPIETDDKPVPLECRYGLDEFPFEDRKLGFCFEIFVISAGSRRTGGGENDAAAKTLEDFPVKRKGFPRLEPKDAVEEDSVESEVQLVILIGDMIAADRFTVGISSLQAGRSDDGKTVSFILLEVLIK